MSWRASLRHPPRARTIECAAGLGQDRRLSATRPPDERSSAPDWPSSGASERAQVTVPGSDAPGTSAQAAIPELSPGTSIGRYMVLHRLGAGAMGVVYAAYDPELDRKVALKLLHPRGHSSLDSRLRLMREAKALARLSHPNVVAVHDVGTYADHVFLAMEFVDGKTLSAWLKDQPRPWPEVVAVMRRAGEGLAAAHDAGLVHRDFKPDNVLIARDGRVRVLDFGLARSAGDAPPLEDDEQSASAALISVSASRRAHAELEAAQLTRTGAMVGTPAYMSPEQHLGRNADARSDQFSFCVTLYQALYGARPYPAARISNLAFQVLQGKVSPPPPGTAVPTRLRRVVLRGLHADPDQRYPGMPALLAALDHEVGFKRRGGRFIAGGAGLLALGLWFGLRAEAQVELPCRDPMARLGDAWSPERVAAIERAFSDSDLPYAGATLARVRADLQAYAERWAAAYADACAAHLLRYEQSAALFDRRMACLERRRFELRALTEVLARGEPTAIEQAGEGVGRLGDLAPCSDTSVLTALVDPPAGALKAEVERVAAQVAEARALEFAGKWRDARRLSAAAVADPAAAAYPPLAAEALRVHAGLQRQLGEPGAVDSLLAAARAAAEGRDDRAAAEAWSDLVLVASHSLDAPERSAAYASAASAAVLRAGNDPLLAARLDTNVAVMQMNLGAIDEALVPARRALAVLDAEPHADPGQRQRLLNILALLHQQRREHPEARQALTRALELVRSTAGPDHPSAATLLTNLGELAVDEGLLADARRHADEAAAIRRRALPDGHLAFAETEHLFASIALAHKDASGALAHYRRALELHARSPQPSQIKIAALHNDLANIAAEDGRLDEALDDYRHALAGFTAIGGPDSDHSLQVEGNLADALLALNRPAEALPHHLHVVAVYERERGPEHLETAAALVSVALTRRALADANTALPLLERALPALVAAPADPFYRGRLGLCRYALARTLADLREDRPRQRQLAQLAEPDLAADPDNYISRRALAELRGWLAAQP